MLKIQYRHFILFSRINDEHKRQVFVLSHLKTLSYYSYQQTGEKTNIW